ncbi:unnamed protein product [Closterium sp. Naga37s-1]|nr:unnamed protein product [Closterium sp. Naga37s-1]
MARLLFVATFAVLLAVASAGQTVVTGPNNPAVNLDKAKGGNGVATEVPPGIEKAAAAGGLDKFEGTTIVSPSTDSILMVDVKVAGWNKMKCHKDLGKPGEGACTPANCSKGGIAAKWKTSNLLKNKLGVEVYVKGNPLTLKKASPQTCCNTCAGYSSCTYWQYIPDITIDGKKTEGACYLVHDSIDYSCGDMTAQYATDSKPVHLQVRTGGECNPAANVVNDPHLVGAYGTHFDFNGRPDKAFCLLTDKDLHVNMLLRGFYSDDTENAALVVDGKAVHTWIKELGIVWFANGADHKVRLAARSGKQQERGDGFMKTIEIDGEEIPRMHVGDEVTTEGGLTLRFAAPEKEGPYDVDYYTLAIDGLVALDLRLRVANPKLQTPSEAEAHINMGIVELEHTDDVHGVLGQTYRPDHAARAADFQRLIANLHRPISADSQEGAGFLDGTPRLYESSSVLSVDCAQTDESRRRFLTCSARARKSGADEVSAEPSAPSADAKAAPDGEILAENKAAEDTGKKAEDAGKKAEDASKKAQKRGKELEKRLRRLREVMAEVDGGKGVNAFIIPSEDPHQSEYMAPCFERRAFISGFTGSAGTAVVTRERALLWTDGRYFLQAEQQLPPGWDLMRAGMPGVPSVADWLAEALPAGSRVGVDPFVHSADNVRGLADTLAASSSVVVPLLRESNPVDVVWGAERPAPPSAPMRVHPIEFAGQTVRAKLQQLRAEMRDAGATALLVSALDEVAWLLNVGSGRAALCSHSGVRGGGGGSSAPLCAELVFENSQKHCPSPSPPPTHAQQRGADVPHCPVTVAYAVVEAEAAHLFVDPSKVAAPAVAEHLAAAGVSVKPYGDLVPFLQRYVRFPSTCRGGTPLCGSQQGGSPCSGGASGSSRRVCQAVWRPRALPPAVRAFACLTSAMEGARLWLDFSSASSAVLCSVEAACAPSLSHLSILFRFLTTHLPSAACAQFYEQRASGKGGFGGKKGKKGEKGEKKSKEGKGGKGREERGGAGGEEVEGPAVLSRTTPISLAKALKNESEIEGMKNAHIRDAVAMAHFWEWAERAVVEEGRAVTEVELGERLEAFRAQQEGFLDTSFDTIAGALSAGCMVLDEIGCRGVVVGAQRWRRRGRDVMGVELGEKLEAFRAQQEGFLDTSLDTIAGSGKNGAIIHYRAEEDNCAVVDPSKMLLLDSGAQYMDGTTDITRTVHFGTPSDYEKECYTRVLQGHISLDCAVFPQGTPGFALDILARSPLWGMGLDYRHGTGHGVGAGLNVHEGPQSISPRFGNPTPLQAGMVVSNEPGFYHDNQFGIRIENLLVVREQQTQFRFGGTTYLGFECLTLFPIQTKLVSVELLSNAEVKWINDYHQRVWDTVSPLLSGAPLQWLQRNTQPISRNQAPQKPAAARGAKAGAKGGAKAAAKAAAAS